MNANDSYELHLRARRARDRLMGNYLARAVVAVATAGRRGLASLFTVRRHRHDDQKLCRETPG